ncbi:Rhs family protein [Hahella chejuensis KCTC 2396]|uniref:Rhs family protein n=1 Tax=Hahella chejuensis (strain KCTC 2396) TaxID=349521 RepID=Q2SH64_HAHCH|nr:RHS repeat-associated core domain-containing protein [Hahella chejuensis]ABC30010.1 Rhs family protein [Hahella chejuensis KCTC 2396]
MHYPRRYQVKHHLDIVADELTRIESPTTAIGYIEKCLSDGDGRGKEFDAFIASLQGSHFQSTSNKFPGRTAASFNTWRNTLIREARHGNVLLVVDSSEKPFHPLIIEKDKTLTPGQSNTHAATQLLNRLKPVKTPSPKRPAGTAAGGAAASNPMAESHPSFNGNVGWASVKGEKTSYGAPPPASSESSPEETSVSDASGHNDNGDTQTANDEACVSGDPVSMITGEELLDLVDFTLPGPMPLVWKRTYKSSNNHQRGLGVGWTHLLCQTLEEDNGRITFTSDEGRYIDFPRPLIEQSSRNAAERMTLHRVDENTYALQQLGQPDKVFVGGNGAYRLEALIDALGNRIDIAYWQDVEGYAHPITILQANWGPRLHILHNAQGLMCEIQSIQSNGAFATLASYDYDEQQDLIRAADRAGASESYAYRNHIITRRTLKTGFSFYFEWSQYSPSGKCLRQWGDRGIYDYRFEWDTQNKVSHAFDSNGGKTTYYYDHRGKIIKEIDPEGGVTRMAYNKNGQLIEHIDPEGGVTRYVYDEQGLLTQLTDAAGATYKIRYNHRGQPVEMINPLGHSWRREYNGKGLLTCVTDPLGNQTRYAYNERGLPQTITDAAGNEKTFVWNAMAQLVSESVNGRRTEYLLNEDGDIGAVVDADQRTTEYEYDLLGNVTRVQHPDGSAVQLRYNANSQLTHFIDAAGRCTEYLYDGLSQVRKKIDANGQVFEYLYDKERNLIGLINEKGERYKLGYDRNERLIREIGFDGRIQEYQYNRAGHLISHLEGVHIDLPSEQANTTRFSRDPLGRLREKHSPDGEISQFHYDAAGRLTEASNPHRQLRFAYNALGQLTEERQDQHVLRHDYDPLGLRTQTQLADGTRLNFAYDQHGLFSEARYNDNLLTQITRDAQGREVARQQGALQSQYEYDLMGRLSRHRVNHEANKTQLIDRRYQYDHHGNLALIDDLQKGATRYHYDALDRLKQVESYCNEQFDFDPAGNILSGESDSAVKKGNRLQFHGDRHFEYDDAGNLVRERRGKGGKLETRYVYNKQNQLVAVEKDGQRTEYRYDALGRRISKQDAFGQTEFLWNGDVLLSEQRQHLRKVYVYEPDTFRPLAFIQDEKVYHYHLDHLGTPQEMTDAEGTLVWSARYKAYGALALQDVESVHNPLRFQGQYYDEETGFHYNRHRYYDPQSGRFINQDPIGLLGGANAYQYAPNPVGWVDPFGLTAKKEDPGRQMSAISAAIAIGPRALNDLSNIPGGKGLVEDLIGVSGRSFSEAGQLANQQVAAVALQKLRSGKPEDIVIALERPIFGKSGDLISQLDIETATEIIEVKGGLRTQSSLNPKKQKQFYAELNEAKRTGKDLVYHFDGPVNPKLADKLEKRGARVVQDKIDISTLED